jgi:deoxycytidine triphosphate deaminase
MTDIPNYSILSKKQILNEMKKKNIIIDEFLKSNLNTCSYDITLGKYFYREQDNNIHKKYKIFNPYDMTHVKKKWGKYKKAMTKLEAEKIYDVKLNNIDEKDKIIIIYPNETLLCHTNEFIGGVKTITTMMKGKSSMRRSNITICEDAGWGDIGYYNRWTLEITNKSKFYNTVLVVGKPIGQIIFMKTDPCEESYSEKGKYQIIEDLEELKKKWKPTNMLPKLYNTI